MPQLSVTTRRQMLATAAFSIAATSVTQRANAMNEPQSEKNDDKYPWIDAHSHIWSTDLKKYPLRNNQTVDVLEPRSFTDEELMALAMPEGVGRVVLIQHYPHHGYDNSYLIETWKKHPERFRIVGQIDANGPRVDQTMRDMLQTGVTGFRIGPHSGELDWLAGDGMKLMWKTAAATGQSMCCLINPWDLAETDRWCTANPDTPVVIDHFARIGAEGTIPDVDVQNLCNLSKHKRVRVKISAYYALGKKQPPYLDLIPMIKRLFDAYGPDRLMWASDCPYQLGGTNTYAASVALVKDHLDFVTAEDRRKLLRTTAENTFFFTDKK